MTAPSSHHPRAAARGLRRAGIAAAGFAVLLLGVVLLAVPVPGTTVIVIPLGLTILAREFRWAQTLRDGLTAAVTRAWTPLARRIRARWAATGQTFTGSAAGPGLRGAPRLAGHGPAFALKARETAGRREHCLRNAGLERTDEGWFGRGGRWLHGAASKLSGRVSILPGAGTRIRMTARVSLASLAGMVDSLRSERRSVTAAESARS
jgi:hypothetical protein